MRFTLMVEADPAYEAGPQPDSAVPAAVGKVSDKMTQVGVLRKSERLLPSAKGACVRVPKGTVTDGPFAETKELIGGFAILDRV
jgi:hypothetical protein